MLISNNTELSKVINNFYKIKVKLISAIRSYKPMFEQSDISNHLIARDIDRVLYDKCIELRTYKPKYIFSKALAYYATSYRVWYKPWKLVRYDKPVIHFNIRVLHKLSDAQLVGVLCHELTHVADSFTFVNYGHNGNGKIGNERTAPYTIGTIGRDLFKKYC